MLCGTFGMLAASISGTMSSSTAEGVTTSTRNDAMSLAWPSLTSSEKVWEPAPNARHTLTPVANGVVDPSIQQYCNESFSGSVENEPSRVSIALELFKASTARQFVANGRV